MRDMGFIGWSRSISSLMTVALLLAAGCAGVDAYSHAPGAYGHGPGAYSHGSGVLSLDWGKCDQSDSTVTCCLKNYPGQYARCGATPPTRPQPTNRPPPLLRPPDDEQDQYEEYEKICLPRYVRYIEVVGRKPGSRYGTTQCKDCLDYCMKYGFWPSRMNKKKCPGIEP